MLLIKIYKIFKNMDTYIKRQSVFVFSWQLCPDRSLDYIKGSLKTRYKYHEARFTVSKIT